MTEHPPSGVREIGLFGGTFDPPHVGHLLVAAHVCEVLGLDTVLFVPSATSPHKRDRILTDAVHRTAMVRLAVGGAPRLDVSDIEVRRGGISFTIDTLKALAAASPLASLTLIIGMDNMADFSTWKDPEGILEIARVVVMTRPGYSAPRMDTPFARRMRLLPVPEIDIASRDIRRRVAERRSIRWMVTAEVEQYIRAHGLYLLSQG
jgi:nicotinate-nucleotide adenylyltransferase